MRLHSFVREVQWARKATTKVSDYNEIEDDDDTAQELPTFQDSVSLEMQEEEEPQFDAVQEEAEEYDVNNQKIQKSSQGEDKDDEEVENDNDQESPTRVQEEYEGPLSIANPNQQEDQVPLPPKPAMQEHANHDVGEDSHIALPLNPKIGQT